MHNSKADLKKNTTDKISAQNIAEYLVAHPEKVAYQKEDQLSGLRRQWGFIQMLTKQCGQFLNQLNSLMYTACPELLQYCQTGVPDWVLKLLVQYPGSAKLKRAHVKSVAKIPYVTQKRAQQLIAEAKSSVASATDPAIQHLIIATTRQILHMRKNHCGPDKAVGRSMQPAGSRITQDHFSWYQQRVRRWVAHRNTDCHAICQCKKTGFVFWDPPGL